MTVRTSLWAAPLLTLVLAGCGGTSSDAEPKGSAGSGAPTTKTTTSTGSVKAGTPDCPLTADQAAQVFGQPMVPDNTAGACAFVPSSGKAFPSATFDRQSDTIFDDLSTWGYEEKAAGIGDRAYVQRSAEGTRVLVQSGDDVFEVLVSSADPAADREHAENLAGVVVDNVQ